MQPPDGPPSWADLNSLSSRMPPPISKTISRRVIPIGTSTNPVFFTLPARANIFVPLLFSVPIALYHWLPLSMIRGTLANVSTLFIFVGLPRYPLTAGNGGRGRGIPLLPSIDAIRAVSSPQTNAPAPSRISISNEKPLPRILSPKRPFWRTHSSAAIVLLTARGYSVRT